jgi:hypothetical protein
MVAFAATWSVGVTGCSDDTHEGAVTADLAVPDLRQPMLGDGGADLSPEDGSPPEPDAGDPDAPVIDTITPATTPAGEIVELSGHDFATVYSDNVVRFGGVAATPQEGNTLWIRVRVPLTIAGAPAPGSAEQKPFDVVVTTPLGSSLPKTIELLAPNPIPPPAISAISPSFPMVGQTMTISGSNFAPSNGDNIVSFDGVQVPEVPTTASGTIEVVVPAVVPPNDSKQVRVKVTTDGRDSDSFYVMILG